MSLRIPTLNGTCPCRCCQRALLRQRPVINLGRRQRKESRKSLSMRSGHN